MNLISKIIITILLFNFLFSKIEGRRISTEENKKIKQARALSKNGLYTESSNIYFNLFKENPSSNQILKPLKEILKKNNDVNRLKDVSNIYLKHFDNSHNAKIEILDILIWIDDDKWEEILYSIADKKNIPDKKIKTTLNVLLNNNKINELERTLQLLRKQKSQDYYSYEMGNYYAMNFSIEESLEEYLLHLKYNPKKYFVIRNRILAFPEFEQLNDKIQTILEDDSSIQSKIILSDLKFREKKFSESYELIRKYSKNENDLIDFSENLIDNNEYQLAQTVINDILNTSKNKLVIQKAIIILADLFKSTAQTNSLNLKLSNSINHIELLDSPFIKINSEKINLLQNAINIYDSLRINTKDIKATYELAEIKYKILGDLDGANQLYYEVINNRSASDFKTKSIVGIIDVLISKGNLDLAHKKLIEFKNEFKNEELYSVKYMQILFYLNKWDEFKTFSTSFLKKDIKENKYYNDALKISSYLLLFSDDVQNLNKYAKSHFKNFQNKRIESIKILNSINTLSNIQIKNKIDYDLCILYLKQGNYKQAIDILDAINFESAYIESAYLTKAEIYDYILNDKSRAVDIYLYILDTFPNSIHYESIRVRLRELTS